MYADRGDAGRQLAGLMADLKLDSPVVFGLPRGGVVVAREVAKALGAPLHVIVVRKLGAPYQPELALGALAEDGSVTLNSELLEEMGLTEADLASVISREKEELRRRVDRYRQGRPLANLSGSTALLIDDGLATGATALAAIRMLRKLEASAVVVAAPVGSRATVARLETFADRVICPLTPDEFFAIGQFYQDFAQTTDQEVEAALGEVGGIPKQA